MQRRFTLAISSPISLRSWGTTCWCYPHPILVMRRSRRQRSEFAYGPWSHVNKVMRHVGSRAKPWYNGLTRLAAPWFPAAHRLYSAYQRRRSVTLLRHWIPVAARHVREFKPDVVHALRLQVEGFLAASLDFHPIVLSTWGNDLLYWATSSRQYLRLTRMTMPRLDALIADNQRDLYLGELYGFHANRIRLAIPATGGVPAPEIAELASIDRSAARRALGFAENEVVFLSVRGSTGRISTRWL